ncbi:MAG TPA: hypothetical protein VK524_22880 [Polyangiaceae bacterium]|nr:hypothetical protein [Polyangiaceae bacterium]
MSLDEPPPLGDTPDEQLLRELLDEAKQDLPSSSQMNALATKLGPMLAGGALTAASSATSAAAGNGTTAAVQATLGASALKIAGAAVLVAAVAGSGYWLASHSNETPAPGSAPSHSAAALHSTAPLLPPPAESAAIPPEPLASAAPASAPSPAEQTPRRAGAVQPADEAALLRRAQAVLKSNPSRALALTQEHRRRFPKGALVQEREVIAIDALARLGRGGEASTRARNFDEQYPGSAHHRRIESATKPAR